MFSTPRNYIETHNLDIPPYEHFTGCPKCGNAYVRARVCEVCNKEILGEYVLTDDGKNYCDNCYLIRDISDDLK